MENVIYLGSIYPDGYMDELLKIGSRVDYPSHNLQAALLEGMSQCVDHVSVISAVNQAAYPQQKPLILPDREVSFAYGKMSGVLTGGINYSKFVMISQYFRFKKYLKRCLRSDSDNMIIVYSLTSSRLLAVKSVSRHYKTKVIQIVPDLPEYMSENKSPIYRFLKWVDAKLIKIGERCIDGYVLLSPLMKEKLNVGNRPWIQMEGVYDDTVSYPSEEKSRVKAILYTGKTEFRHGILDLIDAFSLINRPDYELWIRGNGTADGEIALRAEKDRRIKIFPRMEKAEVVALQKRATVLVNPNHSHEEFTRYFFPSKVIEYMGSGTPAVMNRLACLPEEYGSHLLFFDDESAAGMAAKLIEICEKPQAELNAFGADAKEFIIRRANGKKQAQRIFTLLS